jgi:hypothetical protein
MTARRSTAIIIIGVIAFDIDAVAADKFQKLSGSKIRIQFTGMELSDGTHWVDTFGESGVLILDGQEENRQIVRAKKTSFASI